MRRNGLAFLVCVAGLLWGQAALAATISYDYDALGRLVQVTYPSGLIVEYSYDDAGNRTAQTVTP